MPKAPDIINANPAIDGPFVGATAIAPTDGAGLQAGGPWRGIVVGVAGNVALLDLDGNAMGIFALAAGIPLPILFTRVLATGTTATGVAGFR